MQLAQSGKIFKPYSVFGGNVRDLVKFTQTRYNWENPSQQRAFMDDLAKKLNITNKEDWYKLTRDTVYRYGGGELLRKYEFLPSKLVMSVYPEYLFHITKGKNVISLCDDLTLSCTN